MALRDLCAGDVLQRVPLRCALTDEKICKTDIGRALKDNKRVDGRLRFLLYLISQKMYYDYTDCHSPIVIILSCNQSMFCAMTCSMFRSDGEFSPYVQTLPQTFSTPLYWCPRKLEWLRGTNLFSAVGAAKEELQRLQTEVVSELSRDMPELFSSLSPISPRHVMFTSL